MSGGKPPFPTCKFMILEWFNFFTTSAAGGWFQIQPTKEKPPVVFRLLKAANYKFCFFSCTQISRDSSGTLFAWVVVEHGNVRDKKSRRGLPPAANEPRSYFVRTESP